MGVRLRLQVQGFEEGQQQQQQGQGQRQAQGGVDGVQACCMQNTNPVQLPTLYFDLPVKTAVGCQGSGRTSIDMVHLDGQKARACVC